jgi:hypothetical protein
MNAKMPVQQRGLTLSGFIVAAFLFVIVSISLLKLIPAYIQDAKINSLFREIAHDPDMQNATPAAIKNSFDRHATIDDITAIHADDIDISSNGATPVLSASYPVKIPLVGNISLYLDFNPSSAGR